MSDFLQKKDISRGSGDLLSTYNSLLTENGGNKRQAASNILGNAIGNQNGLLSATEVEDYGYKTVEAMLDAFIAGMEKCEADIESARDLGDKTLNQIV